MRLSPQQLEALALAGRIPGGTVKAPQNSAHKLQALGRLKKGVMNKTEAAYDRHLRLQVQAGAILWHLFESIKLKLADNTHLTVDFAVMRADGVLEMHDVKGVEIIVTDDAKVKMKVAAKEFPFVFKFVYPIPKSQGGGWREVEV